jgi:hypothetical protein
MQFKVFVKISFLSKPLLAVLIGTLVGFLISMDPQVIKKVVPLPKVLATILSITHHYLHCALCPGVLE